VKGYPWVDTPALCTRSFVTHAAFEWVTLNKGEHRQLAPSSLCERSRVPAALRIGKAR
jgi:hypothetical protein